METNTFLLPIDSIDIIVDEANRSISHITNVYNPDHALITREISKRLFGVVNKYGFCVNGSCVYFMTSVEHDGVVVMRKEILMQVSFKRGRDDEGRLRLETVKMAIPKHFDVDGRISSFVSECNKSRASFEFNLPYSFPTNRHGVTLPTIESI